MRPPSAAMWSGLLVALVAGGALAWWWQRPSPLDIAAREPSGQAPGATGDGGAAASSGVFRGSVIHGDGTAPAGMAGAWPGFRGPNRDGISVEPVALRRDWGDAGPQVLWTAEAGEGYAGAAVAEGRVYLLDYDHAGRQDALRCLSLADGREIWRHVYPMVVKRNHGMSRTVPAVGAGCVVAIGPKCHVLCVDALSGQRRWALDMVEQFGATVPPWYAGQCPLIDGDRVILAPGGPEALMLAVSLDGGEVLWRTPNPEGWQMTHSSVMPLVFAGRRVYVYCASRGAVGVAADDGSVLWRCPDWRISIATIPSPVPLGDGRILFTGGYNAGSLMVQLTASAGGLAVETLYRLGPEVFGATQQTPICWQGHVYGTRPDGQMVCLDPAGRVLWTSGPQCQFGLGPYLLADGLLLAMNDSGRLSLLDATPAGFRLLAAAQVLGGRESWGPMALAGGRLLVRDLTRIACLDLVAR